MVIYDPVSDLPKLVRNANKIDFSVAMNKVAYKRLFEQAGIPVVPYVVLTK